MLERFGSCYGQLLWAVCYGQYATVYYVPDIFRMKFRIFPANCHRQLRTSDVNSCQSNRLKPKCPEIMQ